MEKATDKSTPCSKHSNTIKMTERDNEAPDMLHINVNGQMLQSSELVDSIVNERLQLLSKEMEDKYDAKLKVLQEDANKQLNGTLKMLEAEMRINKKMDKYKSHAFTWKIENMERILNEETKLSAESEEFPVPGYPFVAKAKLYAVFGTCLVVSLQFRGCQSGREAIPLRVLPAVTYKIKQWRETANDGIFMKNMYATSTTFEGHFNDIANLEKCKSMSYWYFKPYVNSTYIVNNSIVIEICIEPPSVANAVASTDGVMTWAIDRYTLRKQRSIYDLEKTFSSPYFYTSPGGYRVKVEASLASGGLTLDILFLIGPHDSSLSRSFPHNTTVILFNQLDPTRHYKKTVQYEMKKKYYAYRIDLLTCTEVENDGFLQDDTLYCKVIIQPL